MSSHEIIKTYANDGDMKNCKRVMENDPVCFETCLLAAIHGKRPNVIRWLRKHCKKYDISTYLREAIYFSSPEVVKLCYSSRARNNIGCYIFYATRENSLELVKFFISKCQPHEAAEALRLAIISDYMKIVLFLTRNGVKLNNQNNEVIFIKNPTTWKIYSCISKNFMFMIRDAVYYTRCSCDSALCSCGSICDIDMESFIYC